MIKITKQAVKQLKQLLPENKTEPSGIRMGVRGNGKCVLNYFIALEKKSLPEDEIFEIEGLMIFIDKKSIIKLREIELDYLEGVDRSTFVFRTSSLDKASHCLHRQ
jgi:iron-sulfur cluster assembly protein